MQQVVVSASNGVDAAASNGGVDASHASGDKRRRERRRERTAVWMRVA